MGSFFRRRSARHNRPSPDAMTLVEHLQELRRRIILSVLAVAAMTVVAFMLYGPILHFLEAPYCRTFPKHCKLYVTSPLDGLSLRMKIATYGGILLSLPVLLWHLWRFITPGLKRNEKRYAVPFIVSSTVLFAFGGAVAYAAFPHALAFLRQIGGSSLQPIYTPSSYLNLILVLIVAFGLTFELPVLLVSLEVAGVVKPAQLASWRRWAILLITIAAAVFVPSGDPVSILAMAVPLYVFYETSIVVGKLYLRSKKTRVAASAGA